MILKQKQSRFGIIISYYIFSTFLLCLVFFITPTRVSAQEDLIKEMNKQTQAFSGQQGANLGAPKDPRLIVANVINMLLGLLGTLVVAYMVYGGYLIMLSQGNEDQVSKGKETIKNAAIGLAIILSAYSIVRLAVRFATGDEQKQQDYCQILTDKSGYYNNDPLQEDTVPFTPEMYKDCIKGD